MTSPGSASSKRLVVSSEISEALDSGQPVVALESTIITHGMPYPRNVETARSVEEVVRSGDCIPATIALLDGTMRVGLNDDELDRLGRAGESARKVSRRDLPFALLDAAVGGTTVAATMLIAAMAGIEVFATGGIGGVHRDGHQTLDISADLQELARTPVTVVCAGMKSILDLPRTLEYLETHGVPVVGWRTDVLPAFYANTSSSFVSHRCDDATQVADIMALRSELGIDGGLVVANPIPDADALDASEVELIIAAALNEADERGIVGGQVTPFLLARVVELTGSASLDANIALVKNNAAVASEIAAAAARRNELL